MTHCCPLHKMPLYVQNISIVFGIRNIGLVFTWYGIDTKICSFAQHYRRVHSGFSHNDDMLSHNYRLTYLTYIYFLELKIT